MRVRRKKTRSHDTLLHRSASQPIHNGDHSPTEFTVKLSGPNEVPIEIPPVPRKDKCPHSSRYLMHLHQLFPTLSRQKDEFLLRLNLGGYGLYENMPNPTRSNNTLRPLREELHGRLKDFEQVVVSQRVFVVIATNTKRSG